MKIQCSNEFCSQVIEIDEEANEFGMYGMCPHCGLCFSSLEEVIVIPKGILDRVQEQNERKSVQPVKKARKPSAPRKKTVVPDSEEQPQPRKQRTYTFIRQKDRKPEQKILVLEEAKQIPLKSAKRRTQKVEVKVTKEVTGGEVKAPAKEHKSLLERAMELLRPKGTA